MEQNMELPTQQLSDEEVQALLALNPNAEVAMISEDFDEPVDPVTLN